MPLDKNACAAADKKLYAAHPELKGRKLTMAPEDAALRREWLSNYREQKQKKPKRPPKKPGSPVVPCSRTEKSIRGRFTETRLKCGDAGHLQAEGVNLAPRAEASFRIYRVRDGAALASATHTMDVVNGEWRARRPNDNRAGDKFAFDVSADGVSAVSDNQFEYEDYPNYAAETKTFHCSSPPFAWTGKFDISYSANAITVTVKIKLLNRNGSKPNSGDPMPPLVTDASGNYVPVSDADKAAMKADIESKLSSKRNLFRNACIFGNGCTCGKPIRIVVRFVESGEHHVVNLFTGSGRANATNWTRVKTRDNSWAHETGHLLGWYDEYNGGAVGQPPRWQRNAPANIMNVGLNEPPEYCWDFRDWFQGKTGETWTVK
ncbi:MAG: hypothetical protein ACM3S5_11005 [Rhodospirillales bacterium]